MGSSSSKPQVIVQPVSVPVPAPVCVPPLIRILVPLINRKLEKAANDKLPKFGDCDLGTLSELNFCELVRFVAGKPPYTSTIILNHLANLQQMRVAAMDYKETGRIKNSNVATNVVWADLLLTINCGVLQGKITMVQEGALIESKTGRPSIADEVCNQRDVTIGLLDKPVLMHATVRIPMGCTSPDELKIIDLTVEISAISLPCPILRGKMLGDFSSEVATGIAEKTAAILRQILNQAITTSFGSLQRDANKIPTVFSPTVLALTPTASAI